MKCLISINKYTFYIDVSHLKLLCEMTTKNCANSPKLVLKDLCEKYFVRNVLYSLSQLTFIKWFHLTWNVSRTFFLSHTIYYFWCSINPLHPNISMHILHTILNTFPYVLAGRICLTIKRFFSSLFLPLFCLIQG